MVDEKDWRVSSMIFAEYAIPKGSRKLLDPDVLKQQKNIQICYIY